MNFQQQVAIFLSITVSSDKGSASIALLSLNWFFMLAWGIMTFLPRTISRVRIWLAPIWKTLASWPLGGAETVWAIG